MPHFGVYPKRENKNIAVLRAVSNEESAVLSNRSQQLFGPLGVRLATKPRLHQMGLRLGTWRLQEGLNHGGMG